MHKTDNPEPSFHYIATREEGRVIINQHQKFWVSDCGCREGGPGCKCSRMDVYLCLDVRPESGIEIVKRS